MVGLKTSCGNSKTLGLQFLNFLFIHQGIAGQSTCKTERDCSKDECCALLKTKAVKVCKKISLFGEICNPYEIVRTIFFFTLKIVIDSNSGRERS